MVKSRLLSRNTLSSTVIGVVPREPNDSQVMAICLVTMQNFICIDIVPVHILIVKKIVDIRCRLSVVTVGSRPSDPYFRSVCLSVCLFVQSFSQPSLIRFRSN